MLLTELDIRKLSLQRLKFLQTGEGVNNPRGKYVLHSACHGNALALEKLAELDTIDRDKTFSEWTLKTLKCEIQNAVIGARKENHDENRQCGAKTQ